MSTMKTSAIETYHPVYLRVVPTPAEREAEAAHHRFLAEQVFTFGRQVREYADLWPAQYQGSDDPQDMAYFRRFMTQFMALARQFEKLARMARETRSLPINRERLELESDLVRQKIRELGGEAAA